MASTTQTMKDLEAVLASPGQGFARKIAAPVAKSTADHPLLFSAQGQVDRQFSQAKNVEKFPLYVEREDGSKLFAGWGYRVGGVAQSVAA